MEPTGPQRPREAEAEHRAEASPRGRLVLAGVLAAALIAAVVGFAVLGGGRETSVVTADAECVESWNSDPDAVRLGRHQYFGHGYTNVEVTRLSEDGTEEVTGSAGVCAMVFPRQALDPEAPAAAQVLLQDAWTPLSALPSVTEIRLAELQSDAGVGANAEMQRSGEIVASS